MILQFCDNYHYFSEPKPEIFRCLQITSQYVNSIFHFQCFELLQILKNWDIKVYVSWLKKVKNLAIWNLIILQYMDFEANFSVV